MATIHFSSGLMRYTGGLTSIEIEAPRVCELLVTLGERFPGLAEQLDQMTVALDGQIYQNADYLKLDLVREVHFVPRMAGG